MANKQKSDSKATVTRIKARDEASDTPAKSAKTVNATEKKSSDPEKVTKTRKKPSVRGVFKPARAAGGYFAGAWRELRQVRWPTRGATWSLTGAVILYSAFFVVVVLLCDALFKYLFQLMLGK